jgi:hypothetical protein
MRELYISALGKKEILGVNGLATGLETFLQRPKSTMT